MTSPIVAVDALSGRIHLVRGQRVMLDADLAELYGVSTKVSTRPSSATLNAFRPISCFSSRPRNMTL